MGFPDLSINMQINKYLNIKVQQAQIIQQSVFFSFFFKFVLLLWGILKY